MAEEIKTVEVAENTREPQRQAESTDDERGEKESQNMLHSDVEKPVIRPPFWPKWKCLQHYHVPLFEAVLLSCDMDPESYENYFDNASNPDDRYGFEKADLRMEIATRVSGEAFDVVRVPERDGHDTITVRLSGFAKWAKGMKQQSAEVWGTLPDEFEMLAIRPKPTWPWGDYTNKKLNALADAVAKFWAGYDESAPRPADHRIEDVCKYLTDLAEETVPLAVAEAIDYVIRPDSWGTGRTAGTGFPKGNRKSKK